MIRIGLKENQKQNEIIRYLKENQDIKEVIVFSGNKFFMELPKSDSVKFRQIEYTETEMYRTFYPLLEEINDKYLLVVNECMRTSNRNELKYNCMHKYLNQTPHRIVFEYFPFINEEDDFMILLDFVTVKMHKGSGFSEIDISKYDIQCINRRYRLNITSVEITETMADEYEEEKERLFENLGNKEPDTVPRQLELWCGNYKKPLIESDGQYIARNARFKKPNVFVFKCAEKDIDYTLLDMPHRRLDMNDFIRVNQRECINFISTGLPVDMFYTGQFAGWDKRLGEFYAKTSIYTENG